MPKHMLFMVLSCAGCGGTTADGRPSDARDAGAKQPADGGRASSKGDAGAPVVDGGRDDREQDAATAMRTCDENAVVHTLDGTRWDDFGEVPGLALPDGALNVEYELNDIAYGDCRYVVAGAYTVDVPGALDPPPFASEIGPWLMVADVATP